MMKCTFGVSVALAVALVVGSAGSVEAQETRTVQGIVRDSTRGETLPYAVIAILGTNLRTASNRDGYFVLVGAPAGSFVMRGFGHIARAVMTPNWG